MEPEFKNKWALILGGSSGLGLASAKKLAQHGMNIIIVHRDRKSALEKFEAETKTMRASGVEVRTFNKDGLNITAQNEILSEISELKIEVLIHSIAKGSLKPMLSKDNSLLTNDDISITLQAMALSWYSWTQALIENNLFSESVSNIAFTSEGNTKVMRNYAAVSAAKATLEALMRSMAIEFAPIGMRTNCIQAGMTLTPSFEMIPGSEQMVELAKKRNPFKRLTTTNDIGNAVYLICKNEAHWINGTVLKVDGGESLR